MADTPRSRAAVGALTVAALIAFAANSVLGRLALGEPAIDPASYTALRLASGALVLAVLLRLGPGGGSERRVGSWSGAAALFLYAVCFSFAYVSLDTGTGALVLFGAVQLTIVAVSFVRGHRPARLEWAGMTLAVAGFVYLTLPGATAPPLVGFVLMALSGVAWGFYTLVGRGSRTPLADTAQNFARSVPMMLVVVAVVALAGLDFELSTRGVLLALASGGITSALGYAIWYRALGGLSPTQSAVVQLLVPVLAALGGALFVAEPLTLRLVVAGALILGGVALVTFGRKPA